MKLTIGDYEVNVKAKCSRRNRASATDTMYFLNLLSAELFKAYERYEEQGYNQLS